MIRRLLKHPVVQNSLLLYAVQFSTYVLPLATVPYLSRVLSPERYGLLLYAQSFIWYFLTLTEYGFNLTATRRVAIHADNPEEVSRIFSAVMTAKLLLTLLGFAIMAAVVFSVPKLRPDWTLFTISYLAVVGNLAFPLWLFQGLQQMKHVALRDFLAKGIAFAALFVVVRSDGDYLWAAGIQSGGQLAAGIIGLIAVPFVAPVRFRVPRWSDVWESLRTGFPVFLSMAAMSLTSSTNMVILGLRASMNEVAYFGNAQRIIVAARMLVTPLVTSIYPHISQKAARSEAEAVRFLRKYSLLLSLPFLLGSLALLLGAPLIVALLGPRYGPSIPLLRIMALSPFLLALSHCYSTYYMLAFGHEKQWARILFSGVVVNFALLIPMMAILRPSVAVAVVWIGLDVFQTVAYYLYYRRHSGESLREA